MSESILITDEILDKWIGALKSGSYKQGRHFLCESDGNDWQYCCLGVLCSILDVPYTLFTNGQKQKYIKLYEGCSRFPPQNIIKSEDENTLILRRDWQKTLAKMNDEGSTFDEIADFISDNWRTTL